MINYKDELYHHGIKGQKWGVRRFQNEDGSLTDYGKRHYAENYSEAQRKQDRRLYGKGAERRINKRMLNGENILGARHREVQRRDRIQKAKNVGSTVGKAAAGIGIPIAIGYYLKKKGITNISGIQVGAISEATVNVGKSIIGALLRK